MTRLTLPTFVFSASVIIVLAGGISVAANSRISVTTCVDTKGGTVHVATHCSKKQHRLVLGTAGPSGPAGPAGPSGASGASGRDGAPGMNGHSNLFTESASSTALVTTSVGAVNATQVLSGAVPAGVYAITYVVPMWNHGADTQNATCLVSSTVISTTMAETTFFSAFATGALDFLQASGNTPTGEVTGAGSLTLSAPSTVGVSCRTSGADVHFSGTAMLTLVQVDRVNDVSNPTG